MTKEEIINAAYQMLGQQNSFKSPPENNWELAARYQRENAAFRARFERLDMQDHPGGVVDLQKQSDGTWA